MSFSDVQQIALTFIIVLTIGICLCTLELAFDLSGKIERRRKTKRQKKETR